MMSATLSRVASTRVYFKLLSLSTLGLLRSLLELVTRVVRDAIPRNNTVALTAPLVK